MEPLKKILLCLRNVFTKKDDSVIPTDFSDLAPLDSIDNTSEYLNALDWALKNRRIRNVALCGPYGAGKSSIINSYLKNHADAQQKSLRISMATFIESKTEGSDSSHSFALKPDEIETGILKQLFYKVPHTKIPQSRYRKLHKGGKLIAWRNLVLISFFLLLLGFIFAPDHVINVTNILYETWPFSTLPAKVAIVAFAVLFTGVLGSIAWCFYPAFSRMKISSISISAKANVEGDEESKESIFNKNMDEIVYFFEETRYRYVFFEDLDRLNDAAIFVRLRELNTLLNNDDEIKDPVVFIYAVRDDIFSNEDRTKFFDFLIPIVPFINSTNSGEELSKRLEVSKKKEFLYNISPSFIDDVSPFISDMRILKNIYNEFIIYKNTLQAEPNLELSDESMMALMVFKNLYPKEFAELQKEQGMLLSRWWRNTVWSAPNMCWQRPFKSATAMGAFPAQTKNGQILCALSRTWTSVGLTGLAIMQVCKRTPVCWMALRIKCENLKRPKPNPPTVHPKDNRSVCILQALFFVKKSLFCERISL